MNYNTVIVTSLLSSIFTYRLPLQPSLLSFETPHILLSFAVAVHQYSISRLVFSSLKN